MAVITTKYSVGDIVWHAWTTRKTKKFDCPDCLGEGQWKATSPAGHEYQFKCPRCSAYLHEPRLSLNYSEAEPLVTQYTIGQVRVEDDKAKYMCRETGVGSGSVYDEDSLFETRDAALEAAIAIAAEQDERMKDQPWVWSGNLAVKDYQLDDARLRLMEKDASDWRFEVEMFCSDVADDFYSDAEIRTKARERWPKYFDDGETP